MKRYAAVTCLLTALMIPSIAAGAPRDAVQLRIVDGLPIVSGVFVNGHGPYRFLLDTGSTLNHLDASLARTLGLPVTFQTTLTTPAGTRPVDGSDGEEISLGTVSADRQPFLFAGVDDIQKAMPDVQGILGQAFLSRFDYTIDMHARSLAFGADAPAGTRVPFQMIQGRPVVSTNLGALVLDSGANSVVRFGVTPEDDSAEMNTTAGAKTVGMVFSTLVVGGRTFWRGEAVAIPSSPDHGVAGLLPARAFKAIYVSNSDGYVVLE